MILIKNRLRFCEAFKLLFEQPHKIGLRLDLWRGAYLGVLRMTSFLPSTKPQLYFSGDVLFPVKLDSNELLSEEWEVYEIDSEKTSKEKVRADEL